MIEFLLGEVLSSSRIPYNKNKTKNKKNGTLSGLIRGFSNKPRHTKVQHHFRLKIRSIVCRHKRKGKRCSYFTNFYN
jgi:hypothetical protein